MGFVEPANTAIHVVFRQHGCIHVEHDAGAAETSHEPVVIFLAPASAVQWDQHAVWLQLTSPAGGCAKAYLYILVWSAFIRQLVTAAQRHKHEYHEYRYRGLEQHE